MCCFATRFRPCSCEEFRAKGPGRGPKHRKFQKVVRRGAQSFSDQERQRPLALVQKGGSMVQDWVWVVGKSLGRLLHPGSKTASAPPLPTNWGKFQYLVPLPGPLGRRQMGVIPPYFAERAQGYNACQQVFATAFCLLQFVIGISSGWMSQLSYRERLAGRCKK